MNGRQPYHNIAIARNGLEAIEYGSRAWEDRTTPCWLFASSSQISILLFSPYHGIWAFSLPAFSILSIFTGWDTHISGRNGSALFIDEREGTYRYGIADLDLFNFRT